MLPQGEKVLRAVCWISDLRRDNPTLSINEIVHKAISKFDLNPKEAEALLQFYRNADNANE